MLGGVRYPTVVAYHDRSGAVVWAAEGKKADTLKAFYDELGDERQARLQAVSLDRGSAYATATTEEVPHVIQCIDPFHVIKAANEAIERTRRWAWNTGPRAQAAPGSAAHELIPARGPSTVDQAHQVGPPDPDALSDAQLEVLHALRRDGSVLYR